MTGACGCAFVDRHADRIAVGRAGGREDDAVDAGGVHRVEQVQRADGVVAEVLRRVAHRLADERIGGEVNDGIHGMARQHLAQIAPDRTGCRRSIGPHFTAQSWPWLRSSKTMGEWPDVGQELRRVAADVAGPAGHQYTHGLFID